MNIAVVGAGFTGLSAAYFLLQHGHRVTVFEKDTNPGGLAVGYKEPNWEWTLEKHYHHWFTNDKHILSLARNIAYPVLIKRPKTSVYVKGKIFQLDSLSSVLQFSELSIPERIRMSIFLGILKSNPIWKPLEKVKASEILPRFMGERPYDLLWKPLFVNKFGSFADDISLAWFWARIYKRTPSLAYPENGYLAFSESLVDTIQKKNGDVLFGTEILSISSQKDEVIVTCRNATRLRKQKFDKVIVTLPSSLFLNLVDNLPLSYVKKLRQLKSLGAINLIMRLKKPFLSDGTYWLSVCDSSSPVMAVVEHTNFMDKRYYGNEYIVYLGNYLPREHKYFGFTEEGLLQEYNSFLQQLHPQYRKNIIGLRVFKAPFAQPIIPVNYSRIIPPFQTPIKHVFLANIDQVYPWDRGTNYAVELGEKVARLVENSKY